MKISEIINESNGNDEFKNSIVRAADLVLQKYLQNAKSKHGRVGFSNALGDQIRHIVADHFIKQQNITDPQRIVALQRLVAETVTNPYFEYKLNNIIY